MIKANNPDLKSWVDVSADSDFPIQNIPFGIFKTDSLTPRAGTRIGDFVLDLQKTSELGYFEGLGFDAVAVFSKAVLNDFIALGRDTWRSVRNKISDLLEEGSDLSKDKNEVLVSVQDAETLLPVKIGDYTDFYSSEEHATNVGKMFRPDGNPLLPNWKHIPVGYHGRASSVIVSGTNFHRPKGQMLPQGADKPVFGACKLMDFELEMAFIAGKGTALGDRISVENAEEHIFGMVVFNDWSARDIQKWEYVPLGPYLGKSFASSISPWIVTLDALEPFRTESPKQDPEVLDYLKVTGKRSFDINLQVAIQPENGEETMVCNSNHKHLYWNISQQLTHQSVNGCNINVGDMYASGTISGKTEDSFGSMLELTWRGTKPLKMTDGTERKFINDNDTVIMRAHSEKDGLRIGFGEVSGKVLPAKD